MSGTKIPRWAELAGTSGLLAFSSYVIVSTRNGPGERGGSGWIWQDVAAVGIFLVAVSTAIYAYSIWLSGKRATDSPKRRWSFTLRTLFAVVAIIGVLAAWITYSMNWIHRRHAIAADLARWDAIKGETGTPWPSRMAPGFLWLFGEAGYEDVIQIVYEDKSSNREDLSANLETTRRLFPEAEVYSIVIPLAKSKSPSGAHQH
jgi:hypothetical protein